MIGFHGEVYLPAILLIQSAIFSRRGMCYSTSILLIDGIIWGYPHDGTLADSSIFLHLFCVQDRWKLSCSICHVSHGACIQVDIVFLCFADVFFYMTYSLFFGLFKIRTINCFMISFKYLLQYVSFWCGGVTIFVNYPSFYMKSRKSLFNFRAQIFRNNVSCICLLPYATNDLFASHASNVSFHILQCVLGIRKPGNVWTSTI